MSSYRVWVLQFGVLVLVLVLVLALVLVLVLVLALVLVLDAHFFFFVIDHVAMASTNLPYSLHNSKSFSPG